MSLGETEHALAVAEQLPPDLALLKMENEQIFSIARITPRDPIKIVQQLQQLIDAYPAAADEAIYSKPVGTVQEVTCGDCKIQYEVPKVDGHTECPVCQSKKREKIRSVKKFAEGLSIRAAESIRSIYGYTRLGTTCEIIEDGKAKITGILVDYAAGNLTSDERIVSPMYRSRNGQMVRTPEDRFLNVVVKAEKSKLRRDVILDNTPNIVKAMFRDACEQKMLALVAPEVIAQKILPAFARYGITPEHLDKIVGKPRSLGWNETERLELRKVLNALKNEETTVGELLAGLEDRSAQRGVPAAGATIEDLTAPEAPPHAAQKPVSAVVDPPFNPPTTEEQNAAEGSQVDPADESSTPQQELGRLQARLEVVNTCKAAHELKENGFAILPAEMAEIFAEDCEARKAAIRAERGERSNKSAQRDMFPPGGTATEQGQ